METFTGWEYLLIDVANQFGYDKEPFAARIQWANTHLHELEDLAAAKDWKEKPLAQKAIMAIRDAQAGKPSGHMVGFDASCSGLQIMSAATGCITGASAVGLVDADQPADAYSLCTETMSDLLGKVMPNLRKDVKQAVMTALYGSQAEPKALFGDDTPELEAFWKSLWTLAPEACKLLNQLVNAWQPDALVHSWRLPDGFHVHQRSLVDQEVRIQVEELGNASFTYQWKEHQALEKSVSLAANVVHSIDGFVLRSLIRRCNLGAYNAEALLEAVSTALLAKIVDGDPAGQIQDPIGQTMQQLHEISHVADIRIFDHLTLDELPLLSKDHLKRLRRILEACAKHDGFAVITVHDEFKCHPNNMNALRRHYKEILADLADGSILDLIFQDILGRQGTYQRPRNDLGDRIRQSNYALT